MQVLQGVDRETSTAKKIFKTVALHTGLPYDSLLRRTARAVIKTHVATWAGEIQDPV
jgi:hypothetical protein